MQNELKYAKIFESTGLKRNDAEKYLKVIEGAILDNAVTKKDFEHLEYKFEALKIEIKLELNQVLKKLGLTIVITAGLMTTILGGLGAFLKFAV